MSKVLTPIFCPTCRNELSTTKYDNSGNGGYKEWYWIHCKECQTHGNIEVWQN